MEIKPFKTISGNGYSFKEIWKIYDEQFNILRDIILSLGDKYQVENFSGSDNKVITLNTPYNSNQVFVYCNGVLQWKDRDYRENSPTEIELLFDRKATDDVRIVTIKSNVIKNDLHQYLQDISSVVANAKEQYDSARNLESRLVELYSSLQQTHSLYTNNSTASLVTDLTRLKSEYEKVNTSVTALDKKLKDLIGSSEYILTTLNIDELKGLVKSIKAQIEELSSEKSLDIIYPDDFGLVDVLLFDWVRSPDDAKNRNLRLKAPFRDYKIITFWLVPDEGFGWMAPCSFHVGELKFSIEAGKRSNPNVGGYMVSSNGLFWQLKLSDNLMSSTNIGEMSWSENCKLMSVTGWPRVHNFDF